MEHKLIQMSSTEPLTGMDSWKPIYHDLFKQINANIANNMFEVGQQIV